MACDPAGTMRCTHCKRLYLPTAGSTICPHCKRTIEAAKTSEAEQENKRAFKSTTWPKMGPQTVVCTVCGGDRLKRTRCIRCLGTGVHLLSSEAVPSPAPTHQTSKHSFRPSGKPSDHRPDGTAVCFICDGRGTSHNRTCSKCGGRGYLTSAKSEAPRMLEPNAAPNRVLPETDNPYAAKVTPEPKPRNTLAPWYMTTPPPPSVCISCQGKKPKMTRCARCKGTGVDPWALDEDDETEARQLFEEGWRPMDRTEGGIFQLAGTKKSSRTRYDVWVILHQLCVEKRLAQKPKKEVSPGKSR